MTFTMTLPLELLVLLGSFCTVLYFYSKRNASRLPLPPGPRKLPLIGNLLDLPKSFECETYRQWSHDYNSDVLHISAAGTSIVIVNSAEAAIDLFDKRSAIYSSRPRMPMINELMGLDWTPAFAPYGNYWKDCRKIAHRELQPNAVKRYQPQQMKAAHNLLRRLLDTPDDYVEHLRHIVGGFIMAVTYGLDVQPTNDPYINLAEKLIQAIGEAGVPGAFLVDAFPILKRVPDWFPGASFKRKAKRWRAMSLDMLTLPLEAVKKDMARGVAIPSLSSLSLEKLDDGPERAHDERVIQGTMAVMYGAGVDSTVSTIVSFILAMVLYPEVQAKAHEELDRVVGPGFLPDFGYEHSLPYVSAIVQESLRWYPAAPIAIPHFLTEEDVYKGYRIPANSIVIGNSWAIFRDSAMYASPHLFDPSRFLPPHNAPEPASAFGFGRRTCPGRHMAQATIWITIASILATYRIEKAVDEAGNFITPKEEFTSGLAMTPVPFKCSIKPRSRGAEEMIRGTV